MIAHSEQDRTFIYVHHQCTEQLTGSTNKQTGFFWSHQHCGRSRVHGIEIEWVDPWAWLVTNMGDLVEGVGDEVLLFGVFFIFSTCAVIGLNYWRDRASQRQQRNTQSTGKS